MKPQQLINHLEKRRIPRKTFAEKLGVTEQAISFWKQQGWISYERQCHIELELDGELKANWRDVPADKRPGERAA